MSRDNHSIPGAWRLGPDHPDYAYDGKYGYSVIAPGASPPRAKRPSQYAGGKTGVTMARRFRLTDEGARSVSRAEASSAQAGRASSSHQFCPAVLGCRDGRIPEGWVRERQEAAS
jgi:hypothetical protein